MTRISTHVLDSGQGKPVNGMEITLSRIVEGRRVELARERTANNGRIENLCAANDVLQEGAYCLHFATGKYFSNNNTSVFYPFVDVVFNIGGDQANYHIPLVFSAFGYSTYMGA